MGYNWRRRGTYFKRAAMRYPNSNGNENPALPGWGVRGGLPVLRKCVLPSCAE